MIKKVQILEEETSMIRYLGSIEDAQKNSEDCRSFGEEKVGELCKLDSIITIFNTFMKFVMILSGGLQLIIFFPGGWVMFEGMHAFKINGRL